MYARFYSGRSSKLMDFCQFCVVITNYSFSIVKSIINNFNYFFNHLKLKSITKKIAIIVEDFFTIMCVTFR